MIKLFLTDVDDTLLRNQLTIETKEAIKHATNNGLEFVLCSGRPTNNLIKLADELIEYGCKINYVSGFNGSEIIDLNSNQPIASTGFTTSEISTITEFLNNNQIDYGVYRDFTFFTNNLSNEYGILEAKQCEFKLSAHTDEMASIKILGLTNPDITDEKIELLQGEYPNLQINKSKPFFIEITKPGVNKGLPVVKLSKLLGIDLAECGVCGDGDNDIAMFELAVGTKYVVANGSEKLKAMGDVVIDSVDNNGVGKLLMELVK